MVAEAETSFTVAARRGSESVRTLAGTAVVTFVISSAWPLLTADAAELLGFEFSRDKQRYEVVSAAYIDVPPEGVYAVLTDYTQLHRISSLVVESADLGVDEDGRHLVFTHNEGCLALICRSLKKVEHLEAKPFSLVTTVALPGRSDVEFSRSEWRLQREGRGTRMDYALVTDINFWVPPIIGNYMLSRWLEKGAGRAITRIEYYAWHELYGDKAPASATDVGPEAKETDQAGQRP